MKSAGNHDANRKFIMESRLFHTKMWNPAVPAEFHIGLSSEIHFHLFFFFCSRRLQKWYLGLTAQISRASYHLNLRLRWFVVVLFFFLSNFFFCEIQDLHANAPENVHGPPVTSWEITWPPHKYGGPSNHFSLQNMLQDSSFHTKTTFWCENQEIPLQIYG